MLSCIFTMRAGLLVTVAITSGIGHAQRQQFGHRMRQVERRDAERTGCPGASLASPSPGTRTL